MAKVQLKVTRDGFYGNLFGTASFASGAYTASYADSFLVNNDLTVRGSENQGGYSQGQANTASGQGSHAEGAGTLAQAIGSHAEGYETKVTGQYSHAEGKETEVSGQYAHAAGLKTKASQNYQTVIGRLNVEDTNGEYAFIVGNGTESDPSQSYSDTRKNAFAVRWDGDLEIQPGKALQGTASYALVAESVKDSGSLVVDTAQKAKTLLTTNGSSSFAADKIFESFSINPTTHTASITIGGVTKQAALGLSESSSYAATASYLTPGNNYQVHDLLISNNLTVQGTASYIYTEDLKVKDKYIEIAISGSTLDAIDGAGIQVGAKSLSVYATYSRANDDIEFSKPVRASSFIGSLSGTASYATSASRAASAANADTVNGLTVETAVPKNAKFTDTIYTGSLKINGNGTNAVTFTRNTNGDSTLNFVPGNNVSIAASSGTITISATDTVYSHPTYGAVTASAIKVGRDATGHVLFGDPITYVPTASFVSGSQSRMYFNSSNELIIEFD